MRWFTPTWKWRYVDKQHSASPTCSGTAGIRPSTRRDSIPRGRLNAERVGLDDSTPFRVAAPAEDPASVGVACSAGPVAETFDNLGRCGREDTTPVGPICRARRSGSAGIS